MTASARDWATKRKNIKNDIFYADYWRRSLRGATCASGVRSRTPTGRRIVAPRATRTSPPSPTTRALQLPQRPASSRPPLRPSGHLLQAVVRRCSSYRRCTRGRGRLLLPWFSHKRSRIRAIARSLRAWRLDRARGGRDAAVDLLAEIPALGSSPAASCRSRARDDFHGGLVREPCSSFAHDAPRRRRGREGRRLPSPDMDESRTAPETTSSALCLHAESTARPCPMASLLCTARATLIAASTPRGARSARRLWAPSPQPHDRSLRVRIPRLIPIAVRSSCRHHP